MKWYTCCNQEGLRRGGDCLIAAVTSCITKTTLQPHLVFDGPPNALTKYLELQGVKVIYHRLSFKDEVENLRGTADIDYDWLIGNALKFEIAKYELDDAIILYTDTDVLFHQDVIVPPMTMPLAATGEIIVNSANAAVTERAFNAGVIVMNVKFMASLHSVFKNKCIDIANGSYCNPWYDQGILNAICQGLWLVLPQEFNCRPFFGSMDDPIITHFQFIKPSDVGLNGAIFGHGEHIGALARSRADTYIALKRRFERLISHEARTAWQEACTEFEERP